MPRLLGIKSRPVALLLICGTDAGMAAASCGNPQSAVGVGGGVSDKLPPAAILSIADLIWKRIGILEVRTSPVSF